MAVEAISMPMADVYIIAVVHQWCGWLGVDIKGLEIVSYGAL
jgi:hypothetical protein